MDSLIRFSEGTKTLTERYQFKVQESNMFEGLWMSEKEARAKDRLDHKAIIDGYTTMETDRKAEIKGYKKQIRKETIGKRLWQVIAGILGGLLAYQSLK